MRRALREERWADALLAWMDETGRGVDVFDEPPDAYDVSAKVWLESEMSPEQTHQALLKAPLFADLHGPLESNRKKLL